MFKKTFIAGAVLLAALGAQAQTLAVTGTVNPASCSVSLTAGATLDWGNLSAMTVRNLNLSVGHYQLGPKNADYVVSCDAPATVLISMTDTYAGLKTDMLGGAGMEALRFGLVDGGVSGTGKAPMGALNVYLGISGTRLDTTQTPFGVMRSPITNLVTWSGPTVGSTTLLAPDFAVGWTRLSTELVPQAVTKIEGSLYFWPYVNKAYLDAAPSVISMKAATTLTLKYL